jgi:hypothetical protein
MLRSPAITEGRELLRWKRSLQSSLVSDHAGQVVDGEFDAVRVFGYRLWKTVVNISHLSSLLCRMPQWESDFGRGIRRSAGSGYRLRKTAVNVSRQFLVVGSQS